MTNIHKNHFNIDQIIWAGWEIFKKQWKNLLLACFAYFVATLPFSIIDGIWNKVRLMRIENSMAENMWMAGTGETVLYFIFSIIMTAWSIIIGYNFFKAYFQIFDGHKYNFSQMFAIPKGMDFRNMINYLVVGFLYMVMGVLGLILFIIPGIYLFIRYGAAMYLVVDKKLGIVDSFKMSSVMTEGIKWKLLGFGFVQMFMAIGIFVAGLICLIVGVIPAVFIAFGWMTFINIYLYRKLYEANK